MAGGRPGIPLVGIRGKLGNIVIVHSGDEIIVRERVIPANPRTPAQVKARGALAEAAKAWGALTDPQFAAWQAYAESLGRPAYNVFVSLATKFRRVHPNLPLPVDPPTGPFFGDAVRLTVRVESGARIEGDSEKLSGSGVDCGGAVATTSIPLPPSSSATSARASDKPFAQEEGDSEELSELDAAGDGSGSRTAIPLPPSSSAASARAGEKPFAQEEGDSYASKSIVFTANQPNATGVVTELLLQKLPAPRRKPIPRNWISAGFVAFAEGSLSVSVPVANAPYACAYRFVFAETGQESMLAQILPQAAVA